MYTRLMLFKLEPGTRSIAQELINKFDPLLSARKGFKGVTYFGDEKEGEYGSLVLWETEDDAEAASEALYATLEKALSGKPRGELHHPLFEVYEPKV